MFRLVVVVLLCALILGAAVAPFVVRPRRRPVVVAARPGLEPDDLDRVLARLRREAIAGRVDLDVAVDNAVTELRDLYLDGRLDEYVETLLRRRNEGGR